MISLPSNLVWVTDVLAVAIVPGDTNPDPFEAMTGWRDRSLQFVAPQEWAQYDKPCETCHGHGQHTVSGRYCADPDCQDGRQVRDVRWGVRDHEFTFEGERSARATLQVVPVVHEDDNRYLDPPFLEVAPSDKCVYWMSDVRTSTAIYALDPLPVPGRDYAVIIRKVAT